MTVLPLRAARVLPASLELTRLLTAIRHRGRATVVGVVVALLLGAAYLALAPVTVTATAQVNVDVMAAEPFSGRQQPSKLIDPATEVALARSAEVAERVSAALADGTTVRDVRRHLSVEMLAGATVMRIGYAAADARTAATVADEVARQYLRFRGELAAQRQQEMLTPLIHRRDAVRAQLGERGVDRALVLGELNQVAAMISSVDALGTAGGTVLRSASETAPAVTPHTATVLAAAGGLGLLGGLLLAVAGDAARRRVFDVTDVAAGGGGPLLAALQARTASELTTADDGDALVVAWHRLRSQIDADLPVMLMIGLSRGAPAAAVAQTVEHAAGRVEIGGPARGPRAFPVTTEQGHAAALSLAPRAGLVVLVAEHGRTQVRELERMVDDLAAIGVRPAGTVIARPLDDAADPDEPHDEAPAPVPTPIPTPAPPAIEARGVSADLRGAARGGLVTLVGAGVSTGMGFVLALVLARQYGAAGAGIVQQAIAVSMIGLALARLGMDTTAVWLLPRLRQQEPGAARGACVVLLGWAALGGTTIAGFWLLLDLAVGPALLGDARVDRAVSVAAWGLPFGAVMMVALAATRGFGGVVPFNVIGNITVPTARPLVVFLISLAGGSAVVAAAGWAAVLPPAALVAVAVLWRRVRRYERRSATGPWLPSRAVRRAALRFGLPRALATLLEQSIIWSDVVLVGIIAGPAAAGIYGVASRFVGGGMVVLTALRIVVAPQFSARLAAREYAEAQSLYSVTATWIVLFGAPVYLLLAFFSPTVLGLLGHEFTQGVPAMVILCLGGVAMLCGGNIQSLLLMSGHSGWGAANKLIVFAVNISLNLVLVPTYGITGAATAWATCMALDALLAGVQVRRFTGISPAALRILAALATAVVAATLPSLAALAVAGQSVVALVVAVLLTVSTIFAIAITHRERLHLDLVAGLRRGGQPRKETA